MSGAIRSLGLIAAIVLVSAATWLVATRTGTSTTAASLSEDMSTIARSIESEIERFRYLPAIVARDRRIHDALLLPTAASADAANGYLAAVRSDSGVDQVFVMDARGVTVAASNHAEPTSFVGESYQFRPYFTEAMASGRGRYYGVGTTTGVPGYFLSSAITDGARIIGVAVVKVDMRPLQQSWEGLRNIFAVADDLGIVFLTGRKDWRYRPLHVLDAPALAELARTRKYDRIDVAGAVPIFSGSGPLPERARIEGDGVGHLLRHIEIEPDGWTLVGLVSLAPVRTSSLTLALLAALAAMLVMGAGLYMSQRRQLILAKIEDHARLERRVRERTLALHKEIEDRGRAEADLRAAQATLIETAKLAALGRMSAAIVHEVSQPLAAMENTLASTGVLVEQGELQRASSKVQAARDLLRRIQRTIKILRSFAKNEPVAREPIDINKSLATAIELAQHRAAGASITLEPSAEQPAVLANATRFEQAVLNLLINALDAVQGRSDPTVVVRCSVRNGRAEISVRDNGPGIAREIEDRILEPFFTTKTTGEGLGLGLSIAREIVEDYGGRLSLATTGDCGCMFVIDMPLDAPNERSNSDEPRVNPVR